MRLSVFGAVVTGALLALLAICACARPASARPTEAIVSIGILAPSRQYPDFRSNTEALGYDRHSRLKLSYEVEVGGLQSLTYWLSVGPIVRGYFGRMGAPYDGVPPISTNAGTIGARVEMDLFPWPRLLFWAEPSIGAGQIGTSESKTTVGLWGIRGGFGIGSARDKASLRFRLGYSWAPTFQAVTPVSGTFNWGGFSLQIDGVLRVLG